MTNFDLDYEFFKARKIVNFKIMMKIMDHYISHDNLNNAIDIPYKIAQILSIAHEMRSIATSKYTPNINIECNYSPGLFIEHHRKVAKFIVKESRNGS